MFILPANDNKNGSVTFAGLDLTDIIQAHEREKRENK